MSNALRKIKRKRGSFLTKSGKQPFLMKNPNYKPEEPDKYQRGMSVKSFFELTKKLFGEVDYSDYYEISDEILYDNDDLMSIKNLMKDGYFNRFIKETKFPIKGVLLNKVDANTRKVVSSVRLCRELYDNKFHFLITIMFNDETMKGSIDIQAVSELEYPYKTIIEDGSYKMGLLMDSEIYESLRDDHKEMILRLNDEVRRSTAIFLLTQLLHLNPVTKEVFTRYSSKEPESSIPNNHQKSNSSNKKYPKKQVKYIRKTKLGSDRLNEYHEKLKNSRHYEKDAWYVLGHYRHYTKTDKTIWIDGYWKGKLRDDYQDHPRTRVLNTGTHREFNN